MNYEQLKNSIPDATHYYFDVEESVLETLPAPAWFGQTAGTYYCGTVVAVPGLAEREVVATS